MIGIILWLILIIIIAECANPGLIWMTLGALTALIVVYVGFMYLVKKIKNKR